MERRWIIINKLVVAADAGELGLVQHFLRQTLIRAGCRRHLADIELAAEEIFINIASYAYAPHSGKVSISCGVMFGMLVVRFADCGRPYNPLTEPEPELLAGADSRRAGGLGILLVRRLSDGMRYRRLGGKNVLLVYKVC